MDNYTIGTPEYSESMHLSNSLYRANNKRDDLRTIDIVVISVIAVVITVSLITFAMTPSNKGGDSLPNDQNESKNSIRALVSASEPALFDSFGSPINRVRVGDQVLFQSEITNTQDKKQPFVYIVQIRNSAGITVSLSYAKSELPANDKLKVAQSWIPAVSGKYEIQIFVWDNIEGQTVLSPTRKTSVEVES